jgi:type VI protein secretion system component VasK
MTNMNPTEFLNVVDHAAGQDDRWLFLAAFCLLLALCAVVIYWFVRHLQAMIAEHKALQADHSATLRGAGDAERNLAQAGRLHRAQHRRAGGK